jgi:hypothetical protein
MSKSRKKTKPTKVYPTNQRYDKRVPPTAFRIDSETVKKLYELFEASKAKTWGAFFRMLVGDYELKLISIEEARKAGYQKGFRDAWSIYAVSFPCAKCGKTIFINSPMKKDQVRVMLVEAELSHEECPKLNFRQPTPVKPTPPTMNRPNPDPPIMPKGKSNNRDKILKFIQDNKNANDDKSLS